MVVYLLCYSLEASPEEQCRQIAFWLEYLNSALPLSRNSPSARTSKWNIMIVGLRSDMMHKSPSLVSSSVSSWQYKYKKLPLYTNELFEISSTTSKDSVKHLLQAVQAVCTQIFQHHAVRIPSWYQKLLTSIRAVPQDKSFSSVASIHELVQESCKTDRLAVERALRYFHTTGHVVLLDREVVCVHPVQVPKIAAKFISPEEIRAKLKRQRDWMFLNEADITYILLINEEDNER
jgi:hypothetical protein